LDGTHKGRSAEKRAQQTASVNREQQPEVLVPYRLFVDSTGSEWQVWDIVPRLSERRNSEFSDRRVEVKAIPFADRRQNSRRLTQVRRAVLRGSYALGWLCFDNGKEKRRLSPIPGDWTTCSDELLEAYARHGQPVAGSHSTFSFSDESPLAEAG
jgi:hypothetical protein